jgi:hypothetical protein
MHPVMQSEQSSRDLIHASTPDLEAWFDEKPPSSRRPSTVPPAPAEVLGDFVGDPMVDGWLR